MNPTKRVANAPPVHNTDQFGEKWQKPTKVACSKFQQLSRDLIMDILSRLFVKTIFNCRCVCKSWFCIISDPEFAHLHRSTSPIGILTNNIEYLGRPREADFIQIEQCAAGSDVRVQNMRFTPKTSLPIYEYRLINSCNGLLCLSGTGPDDTLYVCNPILGEYITIPAADRGEPSRCSSFRGIGFSAGTNEYKVVRTIITLKSKKCLEAEIYTIGTEAWRSIGKAPRDFDVNLQCDGSLNGALHWVCRSSRSEFICSFNFETEQFRPIPAPSCFGPEQKKFPKCLKLGVVGGCLLLCVFDYNSEKFDSWVMKDYGVQDSWTKFLVIERSYLWENSHLICDSSEPLMFLNNGEILWLYSKCNVFCYNQETKSFREARITRTKAPLQEISYSPSFVSLYELGEEAKRVRGIKKSEKQLLPGGSYHCTCSRMPSHKPINSPLDLSLRIETACAICGGNLGYVWRGKGFPMCEECFDAGSS